MADLAVNNTGEEVTVEKRGRLQMFGALRHRNFRLLMFGLLFSNAGMQIRQVAQGWLVLELTDSSFLLGAVGATLSLPMLLFTPITGVVADRVDRKKLLLVSQSVSMSAMFVLATLIIAGVIQVWQVFGFALALGLAMAFYGPARQAFIPELVGKVDLMNAIALNSAVLQFTRIIGPAVAGGLLVIIGIAGCFYFASGTYAVIIIALILITVKSLPAGDIQASVWQNLKEGLAYIFGNKTMLALISLEAVPAIFGWPYQMLMPVFAKDVLDVGAPGLGMLMAAAGVGSLTGALSLAALGDFRRKGLLVLVSSIAFGVVLMFFANSPLFHASLAILVLVGGTSTMYTALTNTLLQMLVPNELRGRIMSFYMLAFAGMQPLGSLQAGILAEYFGAPVAVTVGGALVVLFTTTVMILVPKLRQL